MIGTLVGLILALIVIGVIYWAATTLIALIPMPPQIATIVHVLLVLLLVLIVLYVLMQLLGMAGIHVPAFKLGMMRS